MPFFRRAAPSWPVVNGQEQFWDIYGQRFKKALEEEGDADADE